MAGTNELIYWAENEAEAVVIVAIVVENGIPAIKLRESYCALYKLSFGIFGEIAIAVDEDRAEEATAIINRQQESAANSDTHQENDENDASSGEIDKDDRDDPFLIWIKPRRGFSVSLCRTL